ncbi:MAG: nicotinate-nucleotide adenylyltransferase [Eubacteriales bacterium]
MIEKVGILGGTFNPIHNGHIALGLEAAKEHGLDKVLMIPTGISYCKNNVLDGKNRLNMVRMACKPHPILHVSDLEVNRCGNTYTIDTIRAVREQYPLAQLFFIIGEDTLYSIEHWKNSDTLLSMVTLLVAIRGCHKTEQYSNQIVYLQEKYHATIALLSMMPVVISSTEIRNRIVVGESVTEFLNDEVDAYIQEHGIYKESLE